MPTPNIVLTNAGLTALNQSLASGDPLDITTYKVSQTAGVVGHPTDTAMIGAVVRSAPITSIAAVSATQVRITITLPAGVPVTGEWNLRELGIFLANGQMFAHGPMSPEINKDPTFGTKFYVNISAVGIGSVINVTVLEETSIPAISAISGLPPASTSVQTTIAVLDGAASTPHGYYTPILAVRYGNTWGFTGYYKVDQFTLPAGTTTTNFDFDPTTSEQFWLDHGEIFIACVIAGTGLGQSRKMTWSRTLLKATVVSTNFTALAPGSVIAIWKSLSNTTPAVNEATPGHYVLGADDPRNDNYIGPRWVDPAGWLGDVSKTRLMLRTEVESLYALKTTIFPIGGIIMWNGNAASVPDGWAICDGTNGTPNLRDRFVIGVSTTKPLGSLGGSANAVVVAHTHTYDDLYMMEKQDQYAVVGSLKAGSVAMGVTQTFNPNNPSTGNPYEVRGSHGGIDDDNNIGLRMASETDAEGASGVNKNLPPYYALAFIMKLS